MSGKNQEEENIFQVVFEGVYDGILVADSATKKFVMANDAISRMLGYSKTELIGLSVADIHPKDALLGIYGEFEKQRKGLTCLARDLPVMRKNGSIFFADISSVPVVINNSNCLVGVFRDATERRSIENRLKRLAEEWEKTFEAISDLIFIQDKDHVILRANKAFAGALKLRPEDVVGKKCYQLLHQRDNPWPDCPFEKTAKDKLVHSEEIDDKIIGIPLLVTTSPLFDEKGEFVGSVHIARDISESKRNRMELAKKLHDLETFQRIAVDRELKQISLKREINCLLEKLGKKDYYEAKVDPATIERVERMLK